VLDRGGKRLMGDRAEKSDRQKPMQDEKSRHVLAGSFSDTAA
jgi:hypothetical protein